MIYSPLAVFGGSLSKKCQKSLSSMGFDILALPSYTRLEERVSSHADLLIFPIDKNIFVHGEYTDNIPSLTDTLSVRGYEIFPIDETVGDSYPKDVLLNCLTVGSYIFAKTDSVSKSILEYAKSHGYTAVNVNQGYARCTACPLSKNAIITADGSIARAAESVGTDVLKISDGGVTLDGFPYGFIGGACGVFEDRIFFAGDLLSHPDGEKIADFCKKHNKEPISLSDEPLQDVGSIFFFR